MIRGAIEIPVLILELSYQFSLDLEFCIVVVILLIVENVFTVKKCSTINTIEFMIIVSDRIAS